MSASRTRLFWRYLTGPRWWWGFVLTLTGAVLALGVLRGPLWTNDEDRQFAADGVWTTGTITMRGRDPEVVGGDPAQRQTIYRLYYEYQDKQARVYQGWSRVTPEVWDRNRQGDRVDVEYLAGQPKTSRADVRERTPLGWWFLVLLSMALLLTGAGVVFLVSSCLRARRRTNVIFHGIPSLGHVTQVVSAHGNGELPRGKSGPFLLYTFKDQRGVVRDGHSPALPRGLESHWQPGDAILVLFHPHDIYRHEIDLFNVRGEELAELINGATT
jgi:hypothetical protein